jgi:hypothetical protein
VPHGAVTAADRLPVLAEPVGGGVGLYRAWVNLFVFSGCKVALAGIRLPVLAESIQRYMGGVT